MKIYNIYSGYHDKILASVYTDGTNLEWVVDNTGGKLPKSVPNLQRLQAMCSGSSHMHMEEPASSGIGLLRYVMENGDIVEVTSDGTSAMLNGRLLDDQHKSALLQAIANGGVRVAQRADTRNPMPILPTPKQSKLPGRKSGVSPEFIEAGTKANQTQSKRDARDNSEYDARIEKMDFGQNEPEIGKSLMYHLKYGVGKGERND